MILKKFLKKPLSIGAIKGTSSYTAKVIADLIPDGCTIMELGSGNGAITKHFYNHNDIMTIDSNFENNEYSDIHFHGTAFKLLDMPELFNQCVVSSIPTTLLHPESLYEYLRIIKEYKHNEAYFIQLNYNKSLNKIYKRYFDIKYQKVVYRNLPPAVITVMK